MDKVSQRTVAKKDYTQVFSWGDDRYGQLGLGSSGEGQEFHLKPRYCSYNIKIVSVSCGAAHTLLLTPYCLYSMGSNAEGQLGVGDISISHK